MTTRESVLAFLEANKGGSVSGSAIAEALGISRTAVWKAVRALAEEGYPIDAANKKGYCLRRESDLLSAQSIRPHLRDGRFWPDIQVYPLLDSTNLRAKELAMQGAPSGTVILAEEQNAGRGRLGRSFASPKGSGIYLSVILRLQDELEISLLTTSAAAVAVCRAIRGLTGLEPQIKWVNDVYLNGKKVCGILTEASMDFESRTLDYLVLGIGINVLDTALPPEVAAVATSLQRELGGAILSRSELVGRLLNELQEVLGGLAERSFLPEYRERSLLLGQAVDVITWGAGGPAGAAPLREPGTALSIDEQARLIVRMDSGELRTIGSGEVSVRAGR